MIAFFDCLLQFTASVGPCNSKGTITMSGKTGRLFSPRYPKPTPPRSINCTWMITVPKGNFVKLRLTSVKLDVDCSPHSTLEIRDGQSSSSRLLKSICKQPFYGSSAFSSGRHLWVRFQSPKQDWTYYFMFSAEFEAVTQRKYRRRYSLYPPSLHAPGD